MVREGYGGIGRFALLSEAGPQPLRLRQRPAPAKARAWVEVDLDRLAHNLGQLRSAAPGGTEIMAVVKANAYGHGGFRVAKRLYEEGVRSFAVAEVEEAIELRRRGIRGEVLVLGYTPTHRLADIVRYDLTQTAVDADDAERLQAYGAPLKIQVKIDTGMRRLGESFDKPERILSMYRHDRLLVTGTYSHLASSDRPESEAAFTRLQFRRFEEAVSRVREAGFDPGRLHIQSSYGLLNYDFPGMDIVRAGIALYGLLSREEDRTRKAVDLLPALSLKTTVILVKQVREGEGIGYGGAFVAERDSVIATLSIGYADGIARELSERGGCVLIRGRKVRIVGAVCMDQMLADVTDVEGVSQGDTATLIGEDGWHRLTAGEMARRAGTISNEIVSSIGSRIKRIYVASSPGKKSR
ncbi:serine racemase VanT catalytic subunit [Cohnella hongkongensis]|uniref:Alanine racemase n=1 Tax=Cohnella hongkongensis TaxID=178337 RepID=A0ABV9FJW6_9BACL